MAAPEPSRPWWDQSTPPVPRAAAGPVAPQDPELAGHDFSRATSLRMQDRCPECGSGNYAPIAKMKTRNGAVETWRCFNCGYPVDNTERGTGGGLGGKVDGRARQLAEVGGLTSNYQPTNTIAGAIRTQSDLR